MVTNCLFFNSSGADFLLEELENDEEDRYDKNTKDYPGEHSTYGACANGTVALCGSPGRPDQGKQAYDKSK